MAGYRVRSMDCGPWIQQAQEKHDEKRNGRRGIRPGKDLVAQVPPEEPEETGSRLETVRRTEEPNTIAQEIAQIESFPIVKLRLDRQPKRQPIEQIRKLQTRRDQDLDAPGEARIHFHQLRACCRADPE